MVMPCAALEQGLASFYIQRVSGSPAVRRDGPSRLARTETPTKLISRRREPRQPRLSGLRPPPNPKTRETSRFQPAEFKHSQSKESWFSSRERRRIRTITLSCIRRRQGRKDDRRIRCRIVHAAASFWTNKTGAKNDRRKAWANWQQEEKTQHPGHRYGRWLLRPDSWARGVAPNGIELHPILEITFR
jgi:hypothetical protein